MAEKLEIKIRRARPEEAPAIRALETHTYNLVVTNEYDMPTFVRRGWTFVATHKGKIVGAIVAFGTRDGCVWVNDWAIDPKFQHHGIGTRLYQALIRDTPGRTIESFVEHKNAGSIAGHKALGFRAVKLVKNAYGPECHAIAKGPHYLFSRKDKRKAR